MADQEPIYDTAIDNQVEEHIYEVPPALIKEDEPPALSDTKQDYIDLYENTSNSSDQRDLTKENIYSTEIDTKEEIAVPSLGSMADQVVDRVEEMKSEEKPTNNGEDSNAITVNSEDSAKTELGERTHQISLFIKAGSDRECIGSCPFSQRLFMMLWLKGVVFNVTTVDKATKPKQLQDIAPGANPPFLLFNMEELTDVQKCEDYIEAELYPPRYPKLACKHPASNTVGNDIFAKFSALVKFRGNSSDPKREVLVNKLTNSLTKLNKYLTEPLDDEIDADDDDDEPQVSTRKFIDGNAMTIADCNMLPKLNIIRVVGAELLNYSIPDNLEGIKRYLAAADEADEFKQTCPEDGEIVWTYGGRKPSFRRK